MPRYRTPWTIYTRKAAFSKMPWIRTQGSIIAETNFQEAVHKRQFSSQLTKDDLMLLVSQQHSDELLLFSFERLVEGDPEYLRSLIDPVFLSVLINLLKLEVKSLLLSYFYNFELSTATLSLFLLITHCSPNVAQFKCCLREFGDTWCKLTVVANCLFTYVTHKNQLDKQDTAPSIS